MANEVFGMASACCRQLIESPHLEAIALHDSLDHYLTMSAVAIEQCERRILKGESVPAMEKDRLHI